MKLSSFIYTALLAACPFAGASAQSDSVAIAGTEALDSKFTVKVNNLKLKNADSEVIIRVAQKLYNSCYGVRLGIKADSLLAYNAKDTTLVACRFDDGLEAHDYAFTADGSLNINIYRDNVLFGRIGETNVTPYAGGAVFGAGQAEAGFTTEVNATANEAITDRDNETNTAGMLPAELNNLIADPFFNRGFSYTGLNSTGREGLYTQQAIYGGWGPGAYIDPQAFSGNACARLEGQAVYPAQGASLDVSVNLTKNTPYLVRAMIKSDGYEGKIGANNCNGYLLISDTKGEWRQIEGVLTPQDNSNLLFVNNNEFENNGTLWIDNLEVYQGYATTSSALSRTEIPYVMVDAGSNFATRRESNVYMLGLTDDGTRCGTVDTSLVHVKGGMVLKKKFTGSALYAMHFPGELVQASVTGRYDGFNHTDEPLKYGLDYAVIRYSAPRFSYLPSDARLVAGNYMIQFVDNLDDTDITLVFSSEKAASTSKGSYRLEGNPYATNYTPEGQFLRFDTNAQRFVLTKGEALKPFEAYIATDETNPVNQIVPTITSSISRTVSDDGSAISVRNAAGGMIVYATADSRISIYGIDGRIMRTVDLHEGDNYVSMHRGIYIVGRKKVAVQ